MQNWCKIILFSLVFFHFLTFKKMQEPLIYKYSLYNQGFFWFLHKESTGIINACHRALSILNIFAKPHSTDKPFHCILKRVKCLWVNVWVNNSHCAWGEILIKITETIYIVFKSLKRSFHIKYGYLIVESKYVYLLFQRLLCCSTNIPFHRPQTPNKY